MRKSLVGSAVLLALAAAAGCSHYMLAEREPWRHDAELACLNSGAVPETPGRVRISSIEGPGACGIDYPLKVSALGETGPLAYDDVPLRPPGAVPSSAYPQQFVTTPSAAVQSSTLPPPPGAPSPYSPPPPYVAPPHYSAAPAGQPQYGPSPYGQAQAAGPVPKAGAPLSLNPPGVASPAEPDVDDALDDFGGPPHPYYGTPNAVPAAPSPTYSPPPAKAPTAPLGPPAAPMVTASVAVRPAATLSCPIVSALDKWISEAVQPAAYKWFRQPVVEIKQISAYSCRGMNGNPNAHISEHAFGNALDVAEFDLADGHRVSVQYGWHGTPEEQGFLHDVQSAACNEFTTVLAPGANVYHYNHIHVDLMRRASRRSICEPAAIPGEIAAARARAQYAKYGPGVTGSIKSEKSRDPLGYAGSDDERRPFAIPGED